MKMHPRELDSCSRRLIEAISGDLRSWFEPAQFEPELIGALYVRLRQILERWPQGSDEELIEELALTVYLTAAAWDPANQPHLASLDSFRVNIARALGSNSTSRPLPAEGNHTAKP